MTFTKCLLTLFTYGGDCVGIRVGISPSCTHCNGAEGCGGRRLLKVMMSRD